MGKYYIESWPETNSIASAAGDIARHLQVRQSLGPAVVITERPTILLSVVRKQWMKLLRSLQTEHSRTLDTNLRAALAHEIATMQELRFVAENSPGIKADVLFIDAETAASVSLPSCATIYTETTDHNAFGQLLSGISNGGVAVRYEIAEK